MTAAREDILTTDEAARYMRASKSWLDKARNTGQGPAFVRRGARVYYLRQDLDHYIDDSRQEPACPSTKIPEAHHGGVASTSPAASTDALRARQIAAQLLHSSGNFAASSKIAPKPKLLPR
jgi:hypothetical protein